MSEVIKQLPPLNDEVLKILGRISPNCHDPADCFRHQGVAVPFKAEMEQAHTIHFLMNEYLAGAEGWERRAVDKLIEMRPRTIGRVSPHYVMKVGTESNLLRVYITGLDKTEGYKWFAIMELKGSLADAHFFEVGQEAIEAYKRDFESDRKFKAISRPLQSVTLEKMMEIIVEREEEAKRIAAATLIPNKPLLP